MFGHLVEDFRRPEGFAHVVIAACYEHFLAVFIESCGGQRQDGGFLPFGCGLDAAGGLVAVHHRHAHVHPDQVGLPFPPGCQRFFPVGHSAHLESDGLKQFDQ